MKEDESTELKQTYVDDLNKEVIAFANTKGGTIYIGVADDGEVVGLDDFNNVELQCINHIINSIKPDITMFVKYEKVFLEGKEVLRITINKGSNIPYYIAGKGLRPEGVFIRVGTASMPASDNAIIEMIKNNYGPSYEDGLSLNQNLTFIQTENEFANAGIAFGRTNKENLGLINKQGQYTNLGLLFSDQCEYKVKFALYRGNNKGEFLDREEITGSLLFQFRSLERIVNLYNKLSSPPLEGMRRIDISEYPKIAVREAILNSIIHRDYSLGGYNQLNMYEEKMEILSLGGLAMGASMNAILAGVSFLRNPKLAEVFYRLNFIESYGSGIEKIRSCYAGYQKKPEFEDLSGAFRATLPKLTNTDSGEDDKEDAILDLIRQNGEIVREDAQKALNISQASAVRVLTRMVAKGTVKRLGTTRNARYVSPASMVPW